MPDEVIKAAKDLKARKILPVHSSKFILSDHPWEEPLEKITENNKDGQLSVITPMIGEQVNLKDPNQIFSKWWAKTT